MPENFPDILNAVNRDPIGNACLISIFRRHENRIKALSLGTKNHRQNAVYVADIAV